MNLHIWKPYILSSDDVLDFGCGSGGLLSVLECKSRVGVDINPVARLAAAEVQRYEAGLVVRRDSQEFATAIVRLLGDADLRQRMGRNGLQLARAYSWETCGEKVEQTIQCILEGKLLPADLTLEK
jgi:glycosyltransferase involved in cell wall biosynthesis